MLTLKEYTLAAEKIISQARKRYGKIVEPCDELIGQIIYYMANADRKYDPQFKLTQKQYRRMRGIYAIRIWLKNKRKYTRMLYNSDVIVDRPSYIGNYDSKVSKKINYIINNCNLSIKEKEVIDLYLEGRPSYIIADKMQISEEFVKNIYNRCVNKMRKII